MEIRKNVKLLSTDNSKTIKGTKLGYITYIMYLSPFTQNSKGINLCPHATDGCSKACLFKSGLGGIYSHVALGRINKTEWFLENRYEFMAKLDKEIESAIKRHEGNAIPVFRLNGTSDIRFEKIKVRDNKNIFELYPKVQFYDYTKNVKRFADTLPKNYHLTFSRSEVNDKDANRLLKLGYNVAMVFTKTPKVYNGYRVMNGDINDLTFLQPKGRVIGLRYKNLTGTGSDNSLGVKSGFVINTNDYDKRLLYDKV